MHVTPNELRAVRREGILSRFAAFGPVAFVMSDIPNGSVGTTLEHPCADPHWGLVLRGSLSVRGGAQLDLAPAEAFHVPGGSPHHRFEAAPGTTLVGFAPLWSGPEFGSGTLEASGFEVVRVPPPAAALPLMVRPVDPATTYLAGRGGIEVEIAPMGRWLFCRGTFGALSGYTSSWCDLPHWGMVLDGDLAIVWENEVELLGAGDAYYCPGGPPGHRLEVADRATIIDYTPIDEIRRGRRRAEWRRYHEFVVDPAEGAGDPDPLGADGTSVHEDAARRPLDGMGVAPNGRHSHDRESESSTASRA